MIPAELSDQLKQYVEDSRGRYVSVAEVVREAIWRLLTNTATHA